MTSPISQRMGRSSLPPSQRNLKSKKRTWLRTFLFVLAIVGLAIVAASFVFKFGFRSGAVLTYKRGVDTFELLSPKMLGLILLAPYFLYLTGRSLADLPLVQRVFSFVLRVVFIALLALGLGRVAKTAYQSKICTVFLIDVSESVPDEAINDAQKAIDEAWAARKDDEIRVITFALRPKLIGFTELGNMKSEVPKITRHDVPGQRTQGAGTNIQAAMQLAYGLYPAGYIKRAVLMTDGVQTSGDALAEATRAHDFGLKIFVNPYKRPVPAEIAVRTLRAPQKIKVGETFEIHADVFSNRPAKARVKLYQGEALNGLDGIRELDLKVGENDILFRSVVRIPGAVTYALELEPLALNANTTRKADLDRFIENNKYAITVAVPGRPSVLYIEGEQSRSSYLTNALTAQEFEVDVRGVDAIPSSLKELERYDFIVLSDVAASQVGLSQQDTIRSYVRDLGGGFLMSGGQNSFGLGGWRHTEIEKLLPVRMDAPMNNDENSIALCLVIDRSGSMMGQKIEMAKEAAKATAETLSAYDSIEVIAFDSQPIRIVRMQSARNRMRILSDISRITPNGGTDIFPAMQMASEDMALVRARRKHVILLSDGEAPLGGIRELVQQMVGDGVTASAVALGEDADKNLMKMVADTGGGRFYAVKDPTLLPRVFTKETELVQQSAAVEEYFQPVVSSPADFIRGVDIQNAPYLHGYVKTQLKSSPAQMVLAPGEHSEPLLARWRVGLGWALAWTSDVKNLWAAEWLRWNQYSQFWGQLVREHMRVKKRQHFDMKLELIDGLVRASIDAVGADDRFQNGLEGKLTITGPAPKNDKATTVLEQVAPGRYEGRHRLEHFGAFVAQGELISNGATVAESFGHISNPYPSEYAAFEPDIKLLHTIAYATSGTHDALLPVIKDPAGEKVSYHQDLWPTFIQAAIVVFLLDLALRRVRWFDRKFKTAT